MRSIGFVCGLVALSAVAPSAAAVTAQEVFQAGGFSEAEIQKIASGEIVTKSVKGTSERELSVAMAFHVGAPPDRLLQELEGGLLLKVDENAKAHGVFQGEGSLADLAGLKLSPEELEAWRNAKAGGDLNLSTAEVQAVQAAGAAGVEKAVKEVLLGRLRAYQAKGLAGLAPYDRGGDATPVGQDLAGASQASTIVKRFAPDFHASLVGYPAGKAKLEERFLWVHYEAHGEPVVVLTHAFATKGGDFHAVCQRQFYVTASYDAEQAIAGLFPADGGTAVVYVNRTFTDQVTGFGGGSKRSIGSKVLASQLSALFEKLSGAAAKP